MSGDSNYFPHQSGVSESFNPSDNFRGETRPEHHIHRESEPLPGNNSMTLGQDQSRDSDIQESRRDIGMLNSQISIIPLPLGLPLVQVPLASTKERQTSKIRRSNRTLSTPNVRWTCGPPIKEASRSTGVEIFPRVTPIWPIRSSERCKR